MKDSQTRSGLAAQHYDLKYPRTIDVITGRDQSDLDQPRSEDFFEERRTPRPVGDRPVTHVEWDEVKELETGRRWRMGHTGR